jgi:hypothetical protein
MNTSYLLVHLMTVKWASLASYPCVDPVSFAALDCWAETYIQSVSGGKVNILGGHSIGHSNQNLYMYMFSISNGFRDRAISLYNSKNC